MNDQRAGKAAAPPGAEAGRTSAAAPAVTAAAPDEAALRFIEDTALLCERAGHPRMAGRILAGLTICDPPRQTAGQIATALSAGMASVSANIRRFVDFGIVERFAMPADRRDHYRLLPTVWPRAMERSLPLLAAFREVADRGLKLVEGHPEEGRLRVREMRAFYGFYELGLRELLARWKRREDGEGA